MQENNNNMTTNHLVEELLKEKRADRLWKNVRSFSWFVLVAFVISHILHNAGAPSVGDMQGKHVATIYLDGMIAPGHGFSAQDLMPVLEDAFSDKNALGVMIDINSPGGTPVQAAIIHDEILALKKKYNKKVIVVGEDMLTSGAYYVAVAADKIYVNPNTLTGSIGVIMKGFGFVDLMKKAGVERRVYTSGNDKDRLDPFLPQTEGDTKKINEVMNEVHDNFSRAVQEGRKGKLHGDPQVLFSGDFWSGQSALQLGLVDGLGNSSDVMQKEFGTTRTKEYGGSPEIFKLLGGQLNSAVDTFMYAFN